jgi:hypothetical protein
MLGGIAKKPAFFEQLIICWKRYNKIYNKQRIIPTILM